MKKNIIYVSTFILVLISLILCLLQKSKEPNVKTANYVFYLMNVESGEKYEFNENSSITNVKWSPDSNYFFYSRIFENKSIQSEIEMYEAYPLNKLKLQIKSKNIKFKYTDACWNSEGQIIFQQNDNYYMYDKALKDFRKALKEESIPFISEKYYRFSKDEEKRYRELIKETEGKLFASEGCKALFYISKDDDVYLCNIKTGEKTFLFKGLEVSPSSSGKKLIYTIPKVGFDKFRKSQNYPSKEFETYVYDINTRKSKKIVDFNVLSYGFSPNDKYIIIEPSEFEGLHPM